MDIILIYIYQGEEGGSKNLNKCIDPEGWTGLREREIDPERSSNGNQFLRYPNKQGIKLHFKSIVGDVYDVIYYSSEAVSTDGVVEQPKPHHKDSLDYSTAPKMERVRHALKKLELQRNEYLVERHVIGKVSSRKRDITSELANISNRRVPFKWQRGMKIGEGQFGKVYACVNLDTGEMMAMKQVRYTCIIIYLLPEYHQ